MGGGGLDVDVGNGIAHVTDGGYVVVGYTDGPTGSERSALRPSLEGEQIGHGIVSLPGGGFPVTETGTLATEADPGQLVVMKIEPT